jgi:hypothetical protein
VRLSAGRAATTLAAESSNATSRPARSAERSSLPSSPGAGSASTNRRSLLPVSDCNRTRTSTVALAGSEIHVLVSRQRAVRVVCR